MKNLQLSTLFFLMIFINTVPSVLHAGDVRSRMSQTVDELDAEIDKLNGKPEVQIETRIVEKIVIQEKIVEVPVQVQAPTPPPIPVAAPVMQVAPSPEVVPSQDNAVTVETDGYVFKLSACRLAHRNMKCDLSVVNTENDGSLSIHAADRYSRYLSRLFDRSGNEYSANKISMGNKTHNNAVRNRYIGGVTVRGTLHFENLANNTKAIALIELGVTNYTTGKYSSLKFRNVDLSI